LARLEPLRRHPAVFRPLTGLTVALFDAWAADVLPALALAARPRVVVGPTHGPADIHEPSQGSYGSP
jgi:hypothetical protein